MLLLNMLLTVVVCAMGIYTLHKHEEWFGLHPDARLVFAAAAMVALVYAPDMVTGR